MSESALKMLAKLVEVDVKDLKIGMYVTELDRPWLDTTFLFQGFPINCQDDIDEIRSQCELVYVDPEQTDPSVDMQKLILAHNKSREMAAPVTQTTIDQPDRRQSDRMRAKEPQSGRQREPYANVDEIRRDLSDAQEHHKQASALIKDVLDNLNDGGKLDANSAEQAVQPIVESVMTNESAMGWLVRMRQKDDYLYRHSLSSSVWAIGMARHLGMPRDAVETVGLGAMLLDVGKTKLPRELLVKPDRLTDEEMVIARQHVEHGMKILDETPGLNNQVKIMLQTHHERHDGSGYPQGLAGQDIPVMGRIAGLVDYYDAVTSKRPYAEAMSSYDCLREMNKMADVAFQKEMVEQFIQSVGFFPPGTLVQLSDQSIAIVVAQNRRFRLKPEVMVVMDPEHNACSDFLLVDLQMEVNSAYTEKLLYIDKGLEPGSFDIDPAEYFLE